MDERRLLWLIQQDETLVHDLKDLLVEVTSKYASCAVCGICSGHSPDCQIPKVLARCAHIFDPRVGEKRS